MGLRLTSFICGFLPQTHTGKFGGQVQPVANSCMFFLMMRSSSEWKEITASRPPGFSRGTASRGKTVVGSHNLIMAYVHIAHDDVVGSHCVMANRVSLAGEVEVGDWAVIGGHVAVHQWTRIGEHTMIQGGALVGKDIPPFITVSNNDPVRFACVNRVGLSRRGFTPETISQIHDACRILFQSGLNYLNGCEEVEKQIPQSPERDRLIRFIRESQRGIIKPYSPSNEKDE